MSRRRRHSEIELDLAPLIDCIFLLLIFFIVSSTFKKDELALLLSLPKAEQGKNNTLAGILTLELSETEIALNGQKESLDSLAQKLSQVPKEKVIALRVAKKVVYQRLVEVLDLLQEKKLSNINLITEKK